MSQPSPSSLRLESAKATAPPEALRRAGTLAAKNFTYRNAQNEECTVEGGHGTDLDFQGKDPGWLQRNFTRACIRWYWGRSELGEDFLRIRGLASGYAAYQRVPGSEFAALAKPGPDGAPALLQPGDLICNGSGGSTGHVAVYVGDNAAGEPQIVHAMATQYEGRSFVQRLWDLIRLVLLQWKPDKIGVILEGLAEFFDRYGRDTVFILRDPRMNAAMREKFLAKVHSLVGRPYDFSFNTTNEHYYCSEVVKEGLVAAYEISDLPLPWIGTSWKESGRWPARLTQWIIQPENLALSPDFAFVWANTTGEQSYATIHRTMVCGKPTG